MNLGFRAQSAMEYLMTYGWAILIIAVVLGALFALGIFNSAAFLGNTCVAQPGFYCQSPILDTNGSLAFTFGQSLGYPIYGVRLSCSASQNVTGGPLNVSSWNDNASTVYPWDPSGIPYLNYTIGNVTVPSGAIQTIYNLDCYDASGLPIGLAFPGGSPYGTYNLTVGEEYTGKLWVTYALTYNSPDTLVAPVATLALKTS